MKRRATAAGEPKTRPAVSGKPAVPTTALGQRRAAPHTLEEAESRYVAARDAWVAAMRAANSGKPADLASLAIAQEAYEAATEERERWLSGQRIAISVDSDPEPDLNAIVGQELAWRKIHESQVGRRRGLFGRIAQRLKGRSEH